MDALEHLDPGRNWPALKTALAAYGTAMGRDFEDFRVIELGVHGLRITGLANRADEYMMSDMAEELRALAVAHGFFIRQFDGWRDYLARAQGEPPAGAVQAAAGVLRATADHPEIIGEDVSTAAMMIAEVTRQEDPTAEEPPPNAVDEEAVRSAGNILSGLIAPIRRYIGDIGGAAREGSIKGVKAGSKWAAQALVILAAKEVSQLIGLLPDQFGWITNAINLIKTKLG